MTISEQIFESFLKQHGFPYKKIETGIKRTPDYKVVIGGVDIIFEVKELAKDSNFKPVDSLEVSSRIIGGHIRKKIQKSRKQLQGSASNGLPTVLLIYNNIDPLQMWGTEDLDFLTAMHGEPTVEVNTRTGKIANSYFGDNKMLLDNKNTSISAVGRLKSKNGEVTITLFDNVFSFVKIPYHHLPECFEVIKTH